MLRRKLLVILGSLVLLVLGVAVVAVYLLQGLLVDLKHIRGEALATVDSPNLQRTKGNWYPAVPPLCRTYTGLCPADYFGRTMVANLPANIRVGVVNVSVAGCKIELFDCGHQETPEMRTLVQAWFDKYLKR